MLFAANKMVLAHANACPITMVIHMNPVGLNVLSVQIVHQIKPVFEINARILVQDFVLKMLNVAL